MAKERELASDQPEIRLQQDVLPTQQQAHVVDPEEMERRARKKAAQKEYGRGKSIPYKAARDKKLRSNLKRVEDKFVQAAVNTKDAEILRENEPGFIEVEGPLERTYKVRQDEIADNVGIETAKSRFDLKLEGLGPYKADYTRNGRSLLLGGLKGHVATMDWRAGKLGCELNLRETVRDVKWLHNDQYFAIAQKEYVYIYDAAGVELHCLKNHKEAHHLEFLPYHFLLATIGSTSRLKYQDTSTGAQVADISTHQGTLTALCQNPWNAVMHVGNSRGVVSLWSPNSTGYLAMMKAHREPITSMSVDREGRYMVSVAKDRTMAVWDIRQYKKVNEYFLHRPGTSVSISDSGLTAIGWGTQVSIWKGLFDKALEDQLKVQSPYMALGGEGKTIERVRWCPFEDVLGFGHDKGFSSVIVPGAGEANFDAMEVNPYETKEQRQNNEVNSLLNKLQPETIALNPNFIGSLDLASHEQRRKEQDLDKAPEDPIAKLKNRGRGKNSSLRKHLRKKGTKNIVDQRRLEIEALRKKSNAAQRKKQDMANRDQLGPALARFAPKST